MLFYSVSYLIFYTSFENGKAKASPCNAFGHYRKSKARPEQLADAHCSKTNVKMRKIMTDKKDTNDFDFEDSNDFDFGDEIVTPIGETVIKKQNTINEKDAESRAAAQMEAIKISNAYEHIIGRFKAAPRNDQALYFEFKTERLERFKALNIVVNDICNRHLGYDSYSYNRFMSGMFSEHATSQLITTLCDIIERLADGDREGYTDLTESEQSAIKALSIAIIDLAEGNI
ncbi:hypothetical protein [Pseudomonas sp. TE3911]